MFSDLHNNFASIFPYGIVFDKFSQSMFALWYHWIHFVMKKIPIDVIHLKNTKKGFKRALDIQQILALEINQSKQIISPKLKDLKIERYYPIWMWCFYGKTATTAGSIQSKIPPKKGQYQNESSILHKSEIDKVSFQPKRRTINGRQQENRNMLVNMKN